MAHPDDSPADHGLTARQRLIMAGAESEPIRKLVDAAPELSEEQLNTLALNLRPADEA